MTVTMPALATCLALLVYFGTGLKVATARGRFRIDAPATTGHPEFERIFRVQQNTLEQIVLFLPSLWLFAVLVSPLWAGLLGFVWSAARILYALGYYGAAGRRGPGFVAGVACTAILLIGALGAALRGLFTGAW